MVDKHACSCRIPGSMVLNRIRKLQNASCFRLMDACDYWIFFKIAESTCIADKHVLAPMIGRVTLDRYLVAIYFSVGMR